MKSESRSSRLGDTRRTRIGGSAAVVGGLLWVIKGGVILFAGTQPPYLFEIAPFFFGLALIGIHASLANKQAKLARLGLILGYIALPMAVANVFIEAISADLYMPSDGAVFGALILIGLALIRTRDNRHRWQRWPLSLGIAFVPTLIVGAMLESLNERYLEIPLIAMGIGWMYLGFAVFRERGPNPKF